MKFWSRSAVASKASCQANRISGIDVAHIAKGKASLAGLV